MALPTFLHTYSEALTDNNYWATLFQDYLESFLLNNTLGPLKKKAMRVVPHTPHVHDFLLWSLQVFWGQEHLTCLNLVEEHLQTYLNIPKRDSADSCCKGKACNTQPPPSSSPSPSPRTEHSSDDLRTGHFQYLQDTGEPSQSSLRTAWSSTLFQSIRD